MVTPVTDSRSNANDQIAHAANVLKGSAKLRKVFEAICRGGAKAKSVSKLMKVTKLSRVRVLQLGGKLADQQLVHKKKVDGETAYEKDRFFSANMNKILRLSTNPRKLKALPTKVSPHAVGTRAIVIPGARPRIKAITVDDIDQFAAVKKVKKAAPRVISEAAFKKGIQKLVAEQGRFQDWGGEPNDLFTTRVRLKGKRIPTAFAFKGPGTTGILTPAKLGKNGDQIQRLFQSPAEVFIVQYHGQIGQAVVEQMKAWATINSLHADKPIWFGTIDGDDSQRLLAAFPRHFK